jgi:hypothetical protein
MRTLSRILRTTLLLAVMVGGGIAFGANEVRAQAGSDAIPGNYRELIARYVLTMRIDPLQLRTAMIATPYNKPDGLWGRLTNTTVPVVCMSYNKRNLLGQEGNEYFLFSFENGKPYTWPIAGGVLVSECGTFSSFTEVTKR